MRGREARTRPPGRAGFTVVPEGTGAAVVWLEDVTVPYAPGLSAPVIAKLSATGFQLAMRKLATIVEASPSDGGRSSVGA
ncbi:MAG: hypothetical protein R2697_09915 [Ilumatobacteraceae bacterium]